VRASAHDTLLNFYNRFRFFQNRTLSESERWPETSENVYCVLAWVTKWVTRGEVFQLPEDIESIAKFQNEIPTKREKARDFARSHFAGIVLEKVLINSLSAKVTRSFITRLLLGLLEKLQLDDLKHRAINYANKLRNGVYSAIETQMNGEAEKFFKV